MKMEQTECSKKSAYKIQMPGNYPEKNIQHTEHGESLKSKIPRICCFSSPRILGFGHQTSSLAQTHKEITWNKLWTSRRPLLVLNAQLSNQENGF
jgi:hypothetical protein